MIIDNKEGFRIRKIALLFGAILLVLFVLTLSCAIFLRQFPGSVASWIINAPEGKGRNARLTNVVYNWAKRDPDAAAEWTKKIVSNGELEKELFGMIMVEWVTQNPRAAAMWLESFTDDEAKIFVVRVVTFQWALKDSKAASEWVETMPDGEVKAEALSGLAWAWFNKDPKGAEIWAKRTIKELSDKLRIKVIGHIAADWSIANPKSLALWAQGLSENEKKMPYLYIAMRWTKKDPNAALKWAENLQDGESKRRVLENIRKRIELMSENNETSSESEKRKVSTPVKTINR